MRSGLGWSADDEPALAAFEVSRQCAVGGITINADEYNDGTSDVEENGPPPYLGPQPDDDSEARSLRNKMKLWVVFEGIQPGAYFTWCVCLILFSLTSH